MNSDRVYLQTTDEWLAKYDTGVVKPAKKTRSHMCNLVLTFDHHRIAKAMSGIVILSFIDMASREEYISFFNAVPEKGNRKLLVLAPRSTRPREEISENGGIEHQLQSHKDGRLSTKN